MNISGCRDQCLPQKWRWQLCVSEFQETRCMPVWKCTEVGHERPNTGSSHCSAETKSGYDCNAGCLGVILYGVSTHCFWHICGMRSAVLDAFLTSLNSPVPGPTRSWHQHWVHVFLSINGTSAGLFSGGTNWYTVLALFPPAPSS